MTVFLAAAAICAFSSVTYACRDHAQHQSTRTPVALAAVTVAAVGAYVITGGGL